ncbi:GNAT family N-acetyltransferase [Clostridium sp. MCC353]|uniref:GNAT family N-acetyltransferase n=1 Tax=Clostridium sp. MCC353 TaxID=2592646 RepID=UPI001C033588|nr:GNAT family N-acetyltransferase [Clostridium sp. MCC353]MBT9777563.1 GNAT family N-acetyltransferase [Clostridium sp. MCC353]
MDELELVKPLEAHKQAAEEMKQEFFDNGEPVINGSALFDQMEYSKWLEQIRLNSDPQTVSESWVPASTFFAVRKGDGRIVGMIDIRHTIEHEFLTRYGGHIGYAVRPRERRKGYASEMLRLALEYAKGIGLSKVMLGCYQDNEASKRTIEHSGGRLAETKPYPDGRPVNIYWIAL